MFSVVCYWFGFFLKKLPNLRKTIAQKVAIWNTKGDVGTILKKINKNEYLFQNV